MTSKRIDLRRQLTVSNGSDLPLVTTPEAREGRDRRAMAAAFFIAVNSLAMLCFVSIYLLSIAREFAVCETTYINSHKSAVRRLSTYIRSKDEVDFRRFESALSHALVIREAELKLRSAEVTLPELEKAFVASGFDTGEAFGMAVLCILYRSNSTFTSALATWRNADDLLMDLQALGKQLHTQATLGDEPGRYHSEALLESIDVRLELAERTLTEYQRSTSVEMREGFLVCTWALVTTLTLASWVFSATMSRRLSNSKKALRVGNAKWLLAAEAGELGLVDWNPHTDTLSLDDRARAIFGIEVDRQRSVAANRIRHLIHPEDLPRLRWAALKSVARHRPIVKRMRVQMSSGELRHVEVTGRAFPPTGTEQMHVVGMVRDVTREVLAQEAMSQKQGALRAHEARKEFLSRVSHELRTPLNAIVGFAELIQADSQHPLPSIQEARLQRVVDGGKYLLRLVNDLLDAAAMEVGALSVNLHSVDFEAALQSAIDILEPARQSRQIQIERHGSVAGLEVVADEVRLKQVLVNVLSNAIKYNRFGGTIFIHYQVEEDTVTIAIRDEGPGISAEKQAELFIPFHRVGAEYTATEGVGLGLVITRHLVERQGGRLEIVSAQNAGTSVTVRMRRAAEHASVPDIATVPPMRDHAPDRHGGLILYIEDDPVNALLIEQYVASCSDATLIVAGTGRSGIEMARSLSPRLIFVDMQLPDMSGREVLSVLAEDSQTASIRRIALSADAMPQQIADAMERGILAYWTKPLSLKKFQEQLATLLS